MSANKNQCNLFRRHRHFKYISFNNFFEKAVEKQFHSKHRISCLFSSHWPGLDKEEREEWAVVENADSLAALAITGQGTSRNRVAN